MRFCILFIALIAATPAAAPELRRHIIPGVLPLHADKYVLGPCEFAPNMNERSFYFRNFDDKPAQGTFFATNAATKTCTQGGERLSIMPSVSAAVGTVASLLGDRALVMSPVFAGTANASRGMIGRTWIAGGLHPYEALSSWVGDYLTGSRVEGQVAAWAISPNGGYSGFISAARTSDNAGSGLQSTIADTCLVVSNSANSYKSGWCRYSQVSIPAGSAVGLAIGEENSVENLSNYSVAVDPFTDVGPASRVTANLRLTSGVGRAANPISANLQITNNGGAQSLAGIVVGADAIKTDSGFGPVLSMPPNTGLSWWNSPRNVGWRMFANGNSGQGSIVLGNNKLDIYIGNSGEHPLAIAPGRVTINNALTVTGLVQGQGYTVAALPACTHGANQGSWAYVTDASGTIAYRAVPAGGGSTKVPVFCTGSGWEYH